MRVCCFLLLIGSVPCRSLAQRDSLLISALIGRISLLQQQGNDLTFKGGIPAVRVNQAHPDRIRTDNNIFFTGLLVLGLQNLEHDLTGTDKIACDSIIARAEVAYPHYRNKAGRNTYNFWPTDPPRLFPGDPILKHLNHSHALPDDLDDTSVLMDTMDLPDSTLAKTKALMEAHANGRTATVHTSYRRFKKMPAYSTWYGRHMPIDFDFCVLCNVLYWTCRHHLPFSRVDSASVVVLKDMVLARLTLTDAAYASPHYARTPLLLYHMGRLLGSFSIPALDSLKPLLIDQATATLTHTDSYLDKVLLETCLLRLGVPETQLPLITLDHLSEEDDRFVFFNATFSDYFRNPFRRIFLHTPIIQFSFRSVAYNRFLLLEYILLRRAATSAAH